MAHTRQQNENLMLHSHPEQLKLGISGTRCVDEKLSTKRKGVELVGNAQAFKLECGVNRHKDRVALGSHRSRGGLGQAGIGLQGFVKHLHLPPSFVGRGDSVIVARQVADRLQVLFLTSKVIKLMEDR